MTDIKDQNLFQWPPRDEQLFQMLMSAVKDYALILLDKSGTVMSWNDGAQLIKGYAASEIIGQNFSNFYLPQERAEGKPERILELAAKHGKYMEEGWRLKKDGTTFFAKVVLSALKNDSNELVGFAKVTSDVTEQRETEQRIKDFYSVISHELRGPMTSIRGALGLLEGGLAGELSEDGKEITSSARLSCDRLIRLINDLLDLSTLNAGLFKLQKSVVTTSSLVHDAVASLQILGRENELHFRVEVNPGNSIFADPDRIVQVLTNLISNAIKFSPSKAEIKIDVEAHQTQTKFVITDQGPGIPSSAKSKIFERFQQLDSSDSRHHEGIGLGLAISKAIVEQHGGTIDFSSEPGVGTTFWFTIPNTNEVDSISSFR